MKKIIEVNNFVKNYGSFQAVKGISFYVEEGKMFSFLGPNGAGKSTTIDTLCTLLEFDSGEVTVDGYDLRRDSKSIRQSIGVVFQDSVLDDMLTVRENLFVRAGLYEKHKCSVKNMVDVIDTTGVSEFLNRPYGKLSGGQRRRADIAAALIHKPKILFLDEPTTGLDPQTRRAIWDTMKRLQVETGMTIFLTTHYMEEAADSDYIIVMDHGEIAAKGTPIELKTKYALDSLRIAPNEKLTIGELQAKLAPMDIQCIVAGSVIHIELPDTMAALPILEKCQRHIVSFQVTQGTMDEAFISIIGQEARLQ
ncbi:MAG: ABC transporter ATP-binding protein [Lachnospiraceae bacterium]|nr:ABC transporter ATP-binding protein [Lachnospiraceae bacterium]